jgi:hypothetical protein
MKIIRTARELVELRERTLRHHCLGFINVDLRDEAAVYAMAQHVHEAAGRLLDAIGDEAEG